MYRWGDGRNKNLPRYVWAGIAIAYFAVWWRMITAAAEKSLRGESSGDWPVLAMIAVMMVVGAVWKWRLGDLKEGNR